CSSSSPNRAVSPAGTGRTVRSPVHEPTTGILPVTHAYVHLILKVPGGTLRQATLTDTAERWPRPAGPAGDSQAISGDPKADLRPCAEGRASGRDGPGLLVEVPATWRQVPCSNSDHGPFRPCYYSDLRVEGRARLRYGESVDVTGARVAGGSWIGIGDPAVADYRDTRARRLSHAEGGPLEVPQVGVEGAEQCLPRLPVSVLVLREDEGQR